MLRSIESIKLLERIIQLARDENPNPDSAQTPPEPTTTIDHFENPAPTKNWANILWNDRKKVVLDSQFIANFTDKIMKTMIEIDRLPDFYKKDNELKNTQQKKDSIRHILQSILDYLKPLQGKTIGDFSWLIIKGALDLNHIFKCLSDPIIELLLELNLENAPEDPLQKEKQKEQKEQAVQDLVNFFKAIPYAIATYKEIQEFRKQPGNLNKTNEQLIQLYYYEHLNCALADLSQSLSLIGFEKATIEELTAVFIEPNRAMSIIIPKTMSLIGHNIKEPFNQVLIAHILQLAATLAPLCAPKKENLLPFCTSSTQKTISQITKNATSLHSFFNKLKSEYKQTKIQEDLNDIKRFLPPFYESLKKAPLGLNSRESTQAILQGEIKSQEYFLGKKYEYAFDLELKNHRWSVLFNRIFCWILGKKDPVSQFERKITQLKNNKIDLFIFYNQLQSFQSPAWLQNFCQNVQMEMGEDRHGYLEQKTKLLFEIGNRSFINLAQDEVAENLASYKKLCDSFDLEFWGSITAIDTQLLKNWMTTYLQIHRYQFQLNPQKDSEQENIDITIANLDCLSLEITKQTQLLEKLKTQISNANQDNCIQIHASIAGFAGIPLQQIPASIQAAMKKEIKKTNEVQLDFAQIEPSRAKNYLQKKITDLNKTLGNPDLWNGIKTSYFFGFTKEAKENCKKAVVNIIQESEDLNTDSSQSDIVQLQNHLTILYRLQEEILALEDNNYEIFLKKYKNANVLSKKHL